ELWASDGTATGTEMIREIHSGGGSFPSNFYVFNQKLFFSATNDSSGYEVWTTDGTAAGTTMLTEVDTTGGSFPQGFIAYNGLLYFQASSYQHGGAELWVTDGTAAGTQLLQDFNPAGHSFPLEYGGLVFDSLLYLTAFDSNQSGKQLYAYNSVTDS